MKHSHILILALLCCAVLAMPVGANAFSAWSAYGDAWKATNDTYTIVMWNATGSHSWVATGNASSVEYLVVGGGGSSGSDISGAGGAGEYLAGIGLSVSGIETITVGNGGVNSDGNLGVGSVDSAGSSLTNDGATITAIAGGRGGNYYDFGPVNNGRDGGSGGGGACWNGAGGAGSDGTNVGSSYLRGHNGGGSLNTGANWGTGGGGGSTGLGVSGVTNKGGDGGAGTSNSITGTATFYAAGGGGGVQGGTIGSGGSGIGGNGGKFGVSVPTNGANNTGSGGGGGTRNGGSNGGSGIVIIKYANPPPVASFTTNTTSGHSPLAVQFNDTSSNTPTSWVWNATNVTGNNVPFTFNSTSANPVYTFGQGNYTISLNATNAVGSNTSTQVTWVNVTRALQLLSQFLPVVNQTGTAPYNVQFIDTSTWV